MSTVSENAGNGSGLRGFFFIAPDYTFWSPAIMRSLAKTCADAKFSAVVLGELVYEVVGNMDESLVSPVFRIDDLERAWLAAPVDESRIRHYEERLEPGALRRILAGDRFVAAGLAPGGILPETPLRRACNEFSAQQRYVVGVLDFLFEHLESTRPDFAFFSSVADAFSTAAEVVCRELGIPFLSVYQTGIGTLCVIDELYQGRYTVVQEDFERSLDNGSRDEEQMQTALRYIEEFRDRPRPPDYKTYSDSADGKLMPAIDLAALVWRTMTGREPESLQHAYPGALLADQLMSKLRRWRAIRSPKFHRLDDFCGREFAFYPLHYDPEGSTMIWAPMHANQLPVLEALSKSLPLNMFLAVKEHPAMLGRRPANFYKEIDKLPGVVLVSAFEDTFELIKASKLVCTITGTAGWEALLLRKPVLSVGPARACAVGEGAVYCPDLSSLPAGIKRALSMKPASDERLALFLACMRRNGFDFSPAIYKERMSEESSFAKHLPVVDMLAGQILRFLDKQAEFSQSH